MIIKMNAHQLCIRIKQYTRHNANINNISELTEQCVVCNWLANNIHESVFC